ncbi:MAG: hypothetical protein KGR98_07475, partial [Verrucomicrobia bacterium]|nr:hypothetical protein [Verrucomicrobiota bacterium]
MKWSRWEKFIRMCADPVRAKDFLKALDKTDGRQLNGLSAESARILTAVLGASRALGGLLTANPALLSIFESDHLAFPRRKEGLQREAGEAFKNPLLHGQYSAALAELRRVKQREMLRIAARDLGGLSDVVGITRELSDLADTCLEAVLQICRHELVAQCGAPFHQDAAGKWQPSAFCALALGKLGGRELNYSSDVDLLFLYDQDGETFREPPRKNKPARGRMPNARFFSKLAEQFVAEISRTTPEGILYRVDLRLRPDGQTGAIVRSLEAYENYYSEWGRTWERMMLIKARHAAGDRALADEFLEMIQPFRYPRAISPDIFQEISATRERIEKEIVGGRELERNVKLGRGGIREIEFIVQSLQVLHAGNSPFLQLPQTLGAIAKLAEYHLLRREAADGLDAAYRFLRNVEHRLQMEDNLQTHTVPERGPSLLRLAGTMGFASAKKFTAALRAHGKIVRQEYDKLIGPARTKEADLFPPDFAGMEDRWMALLGAHSFRDPEAAAGLFKEFAEGPGYVHVGLRTTALARKLIARFLAFCPVVENGGAGRRPPVKRILSDPDRVLVRLDRFVAAYGAPAALMEFW